MFCIAYNPPVSVSAEPYDPRRPSDSEIHDPQYHADEAPNESAAQSGQPFPRESQVDSDKKLPSQLRVQAQGALLGLAPHNIRYNELVGEGINPATLRRLYEEVGIRVGTPQPDTALTSKVISSLSDTSPISVHSPDLPTNQPGSLASSNVSQAKQASVVPLNGEASQQSERVKSVNGARPISAQAEASKPLERKELIARMLAAKAAKSAGDTSSSKADAGEGPLMVSNTDTNDIDKTTSGLSSPEEACKAKDTRTKEKNRAQTELARQRIEQLKKQGLMRSQSRPQADSAFQAASLQTSTVDQPPTTPGTTSAVDQHPLPDRPPDPEPEPIAHLPGLFMIPSAQGSLNESYSMSDYNHSVGSAPYSRAGQRKRPRASDFDEPTILPKKPFSPGAGATGSGDRLVIDISDDEFYGDDEHDIDMGTPADKVPDASSSIAPSEPKVPSHRKFPLLADTLPPKPTNSVNSRNSASTTPQAWKTADEENLRKKDLAIREMHRKIAELEQRKKQKLPESPTQSLRVLDSPASSMDVEQAASANHPGSKALEDISRGQSAEQFASMDSGQLERLRSKLLRKKEIEAGLPSLDDEIIRSETRLSDFKKEEERLLLELTKGKEGRRQLMEELKALDLEVNELSFQDVEVAGHGRQAVDKPSDNGMHAPLG